MSDELQFAHYPFEGEDPPESWEMTALNNVLENIRPGFASGQHNKDGEGIPHLRPMNISPSGSIDLSEVLYVQGDNSLRLRREDVLFNNTNSPAWVGKTALIETDDELAFSNHMTRLRISPTVHPKFIANQLHFLCSQGFFRHHCKKHVNQASIATEFLSRCVPVRIPPAPEQRRIVAKIEALQKRSRRTRKALSEVVSLLEQFRQSVLAAAFRGDLTNDWRAAHPNAEPASELLHRIRTERRRHWEQAELAKYETKGQKPPEHWKDKYKEPEPVDDPNLPELPDTWRWTNLENVSAWVKDGTHWPPKTTREGIPFIGIRNVIDGRIDWSSIDKWVSEETHAELTAHFPHALGDVLYTAVGATFGRAFPIEDDRKFVFQRHIAHIRPLSSVNSTFLVNALNSPPGFQQAKKVARGAAQPTVTLGELKRIRIPLCPIAEQQEISSRVRHSFEAIDSIYRWIGDALSRLDHLNQSILAKAFRGELVPQDPCDEPASVLLERIRAQPKRQAQDC